jgi:3-phosphoshikimate 1-carboxyvinyltransferase
VKIELRREKPLKGEIRLPPDRHQAFHALFLSLLAPGRTLLRGWQSTPEWENVRGWLAGLGAEASLDAEGLVVGPPIDLRERSEFVLDPFLPPQVAAGFLALCAGFSRAEAPVDVVCPPQAVEPLAPWREALREAGWTSHHEERDGSHAFRFKGRVAPLRELVCRHPRTRAAWTLAALSGREALEFQEPSGAADPFEDTLPLFGLEIESPREAELAPEEEELRRRMQRMRGPSRKLLARRIPVVQFLSPSDVRLKGDLDLAGWCAVTACLRRSTDALLQEVTLPASRSGLFGCLRRMGGDVEIVRRSESKGVPSGDVRIRHGRMVGRKFDAQDVPGLAGFAGLLAAAAVAAEAETVLSGLSELRVEKDDRLSVLAEGLRSFGVGVGLFPDGLVLRGEEQPGSEAADAQGFPDAALALHALGSSCPGRTELSGAGHLPVSWPHLLRVLSSEEG